MNRRWTATWGIYARLMSTMAQLTVVTTFHINGNESMIYRTDD